MKKIKATAINITAAYPRNNKKNNKLTVIMLVYSPRKKQTKPTALCSVKKPATYSDSASGRSKGALFVSAMAEIINNSAIGNNANNN